MHLRKLILILTTFTSSSPYSHTHILSTCGDKQTDTDRQNREKQEIETLINEGALLLAKYLRGEIDSWFPRVPAFPFPTVHEFEVAAKTQKDVRNE